MNDGLWENYAYYVDNKNMHTLLTSHIVNCNICTMYNNYVFLIRKSEEIMLCGQKREEWGSKSVQLNYTLNIKCMASGMIFKLYTLRKVLYAFSVWYENLTYVLHTYIGQLSWFHVWKELIFIWLALLSFFLFGFLMKLKLSEFVLHYVVS